MSVLIPFKTKTKDESTHTISDGLGTELEVPYYGSITYNESELIARLVANTTDQYLDPVFRGDLVALMLALRFKAELKALPWDSDRSEWDEFKLEILSGGNLSEAMIDALYNYFNEERSRHIPSSQLMRIDGKDGEEQAIVYAKKVSGIVATREDLKKLNIYFVFKSSLNVDALNLNEEVLKWQVIKSFEPQQGEDAPTGKSRKLTGAVTTGS